MFSWAEVEFSLHMEDVIVRERGEIGAVGDVLADELVGILNKVLLPRGVWVSEEDLGVERFGDEFVFGELGSVVGGDGKDVVFKWLEHPDNEPGHRICVLSSWRLGDETLFSGALDEGHDGTLPVLAHDGIHLPVAET